MGRVDEAALAETREKRFLTRQARIQADLKLDSRIKGWYLDRTIWDTNTAARELGISAHRISDLRGGRATTRRTPPHPAAFPEMDTVEGYTANVPSPGVEAGRVREWAVQRGTHLLDPETGELTKTSSRHGRPRHDRLTHGRPHAPGQRRGE